MKSQLPNGPLWIVLVWQLLYVYLLSAIFQSLPIVFFKRTLEIYRPVNDVTYTPSLRIPILNVSAN